jgi:hypothetical protein
MIWLQRPRPKATGKDQLIEHASPRLAPTSVKPVARRYAIHAALAAAAATFGSAVLGSRTPDVANAATGSFTSSSPSTPALSATGSSGADGVDASSDSAIGVDGSTGSSGHAAVRGTNTGGNTGVRGVANSSVGTNQVGGVVGVNSGSDPGVVGTNSGFGDGVFGQSAGGNGVEGQSTSFAGSGVYGECDTSGASGVRGFSGPGSGVYGQGTVAGVWGDNLSNGPGVFGRNTMTGGGTGVYGLTGSVTNAGVQGENTEGGPGVSGTSKGGTGVLGTSTNAIGVWGVTATSGQGLANPAVAGSNDGGGAGLVGFTTGPSSIGLGGATDVGIGAYGSSQTGIGLFGYSSTGIAINGISPGGGYAGYFSGSVFVTGSLTAMGAKSAAVKTKGGLSRVYSLESPESWFEDFGSGQLTGGVATVFLEPGFAGIVHTDAYHVFLTPQGDCKGLYVSSKSGGSFSVHELQSGTSNTAFDYRVVAKRLDIEGARLEHIDQPHPIDGPREPVMDDAPKPPSIQAPTPIQVPRSGR